MADREGEGHNGSASAVPPAGPPSGKSAQTLASPRKQGRFLIIEPPKMDDDEDSMDSRSGQSASSSASPRGAPSSEIQSRFALATSSNVGASAVGLEPRGGHTGVQAGAGPTTGAPSANSSAPSSSELGGGGQNGASSSASRAGQGAPSSTGSLSSSSSSSHLLSAATSSSSSQHQHQYVVHHQIPPARQQHSPQNGASSSSSPQPAPASGGGFTVKNTVGPLFDPAMASAMGWDDDSSGADADSSSEQQISISVPVNLLPPMSTYGSGQVPQRERERIRREWLDNIMIHKAEQDRIQQERLARQQRDLAAKEAAAAAAAAAQAAQAVQAAAAATPTPSTATTASSIPSHEEGTPRSATADSSSSLAVRKVSDATDSHTNALVLDLPMYQANKRASGEAALRSAANGSPPLVSPTSGRRTDHRRSASDISLEARMQARRDSGPPPPRPTDGHEVARSVSTTNARSPRDLTGGVRINDSPTTIDLTSSHGDIIDRPPLTQSVSELALSSSAEVSRSGTGSGQTSPTGKRPKDSAIDSTKTRGRSASVSKKLGGLFGRIFESKPKDKVEKASKSQHRSDGSTKKTKNRGTSVSSGSPGGSPGGTQHSIVHYPGGGSGGDTRVSVEDSAESSSASHTAASPPTSTDSLFSGSTSADSLAITANHSSISPSPSHLGGGSPVIISNSSGGISALPRDLVTNSPVLSASAPHIAGPPASPGGPMSSSSLSSITVNPASSSAPALTLSSDAASSSSTSSSRAARPKPPIPPKPNSLLRHAQTLRPATSTRKEFGLDDSEGAQ